MGPGVLDRHRRGSCDHERMLRSVKVPGAASPTTSASIDEPTGALMGASSDLQAATGPGAPHRRGSAVRVRRLPTTAHSMHGTDPQLYVDTLTGWVDKLL